MKIEILGEKLIRKTSNCDCGELFCWLENERGEYNQALCGIRVGDYIDIANGNKSTRAYHCRTCGRELLFKK
jgi:hypothetical protein